MLTAINGLLTAVRRVTASSQTTLGLEGPATHQMGSRKRGTPVLITEQMTTLRITTMGTGIHTVTMNMMDQMTVQTKMLPHLLQNREKMMKSWLKKQH